MARLLSRNDASPAGLSTGLEALARAGSDIEARHARRSLQQQLFGAATPPTIDRYVVLRKLGAGGMGIVYAAHDPQLDREVAIKVLRSGDDRRLLREAEALAKLTHPNVVQVFGIGTESERPFIVMELVPGLPLDRWQLESHSTRQILDLYLQIGEGLAAAHDAGLVHRDFKPQNVLVGDDGRPRVLDFGLARASEDIALLATAPGSGGSGEQRLPSKPITRRGAVLGTLAYMAPEQFRGEDVTALADQYAFCLSLWEAVYGAQPFPTDSLARMMTAREEGLLVAPLTGVSVPRWLRGVLARGLAPSAADRYATLRRLLDELRRRRDRRRRRAILIGTAIAATVVGGLAFLAMPSEGRACVEDQDALRGAWDPARREGVGQAMRATSLAHAAELERALVDRLDAYAAQWHATRTAACEATHVRGEQSDAVLDRRMACLQRRRVELQALTDLLVHADTPVAANALSAVDGLPRPAACEAETEASTRTIDPTLAPELDAIRAELASVNVLRDTGQHEEALGAGEPLLPRARRVGDPQLLAEVEHALGQVFHRLGREPDANASFREAYWAATEAGDDALAADSASMLMETLVVSPHPREDADRWRRIAESAAARLPDPESVRSEMLMRYGRILEQAGAVGEAQAALEEAVEIRTRRLGSRHESLRFTLSYLAMIMSEAGDPEAARPIHAEALSIAEEALGPHHTDLARLLSNASGTDAQLGDFAAAMEKLGRAHAIFEAMGPGHAYDLGTTELNLALLSAELGNGAEALAHAQRAVEIMEGFAGDPKLVAALGMLAELQLEFADARQALVSIERALALLGPGVLDRACEAHAVAASIQQVLGDVPRSEAHIEEAERCPDPGAHRRLGLIHLWCATSKPERAEPHVAALVAQDPANRAELEQQFPDCVKRSR